MGMLLRIKVLRQLLSIAKATELPRAESVRMATILSYLIVSRYWLVLVPSQVAAICIEVS